ncbi:hypothetical protein K1T71_011220 [Dendrolimus kikuchii]|uniref:Uncharacterized protein n=1 Tax=Dendrolimus kikuchii TaxID=765133 RepID=A0ACC1CN50_9NEOP|nr:hypothetical protein K1T71_011220 [Dendrolimus kikuchii]
MEPDNTTSCEEFSRYARFNPYSVTDEYWFVFYYWAPPLGYLKYLFKVPDAEERAYLHHLTDGKVEVPVNWTAKIVILKDMYNVTKLLVERSDRGEYWLYPLITSEKIEPEDVRFKQTGDNKYICLVHCDSMKAFVMSRYSDIPRKNKIQDEAAKFGFKSRGGKSYLYQGHHWMPIGEADDIEFRLPPQHAARYHVYGY